jgi:hypothetical protein
MDQLDRKGVFTTSHCFCDKHKMACYSVEHHNLQAKGCTSISTRIEHDITVDEHRKEGIFNLMMDCCKENRKQKPETSSFSLLS